MSVPRRLRKSALITGITGQDGFYLAEYLLAKNYSVYGLVRHTTQPHAIDERVHIITGDLTDSNSLVTAIRRAQPDEIYNLAALSHVGVSFTLPEATGNITGLGTLRLLEALHETGSGARFYQASSSEMFGNAPPPQNENTAFEPRSPYAAAKVYAYWMIRNYREAFGMHVCNGILFNHESPRRGEQFVTRKITKAVARILAGRQSELKLGNLNAKRDWGSAPDYVDAMWRILQHPDPDDYVIATGETHSVKEFLGEAFGYVGLDWRKYVVVDSAYYRPTDVENLCGDASKARVVLGWKPQVTFKELVRQMIDADLRAEAVTMDSVHAQ